MEADRGDHGSVNGGLVTILDFRRAYNEHKDRLLKLHTRDKAMELAVGGDFVATGILQRELLIMCGLTPKSALVDVGCGSGRLAVALKDYLRGPYLGTDVVADFLKYGQRVAGRRDFRFMVTQGLDIPARDAEADMVCFFSVFTHLLHEQSYRYLQEAMRVLRGGGFAVFSFLEFAMDFHWNVFQETLQQQDEPNHLNMFIERPAISAWARHLGFEIERFIDGDERVIPLPHPVQTDDGSTLEGLACFNQSVCVLKKLGPS
jgi:ubiquinone/menaquinone biosynthesis C-methylase UbiE